MEGEVARIRKKIDAELEGMQRGFSDFAVTGKHDIITHKYESLGKYQEQLALSMGDEAATIYICEAYIRIVG